MKKKHELDYAELGILVDQAGLLEGELISEKEVYSYILEKGYNPFIKLPTELNKLEELGYIIRYRKSKKPEKINRDEMIYSLFKLEDKLIKMHKKIVSRIDEESEKGGENILFEDKKLKRILGELLLIVQKACELFEEED